MLIAIPLGRRFGGKGLSLFVLLLSFLQAAQVLVPSLLLASPDRIWFSRLLPLATVSGETAPFLAGAAIYIAALSLGLLITRRIGKIADRTASYSPRSAVL
jgi:hypothetical protein